MAACSLAFLLVTGIAQDVYAFRVEISTHVETITDAMRNQQGNQAYANSSIDSNCMHGNKKSAHCGNGSISVAAIHTQPVIRRAPPRAKPPLKVEDYSYNGPKRAGEIYRPIDFEYERKLAHMDTDAYRDSLNNPCCCDFLNSDIVSQDVVTKVRRIDAKWKPKLYSEKSKEGDSVARVGKDVVLKVSEGSFESDPPQWFKLSSVQSDSTKKSFNKSVDHTWTTVWDSKMNYKRFVIEDMYTRHSVDVKSLKCEEAEPFRRIAENRYRWGVGECEHITVPKKKTTDCAKLAKKKLEATERLPFKGPDGVTVWARGLIAEMSQDDRQKVYFAGRRALKKQLEKLAK